MLNYVPDSDASTSSLALTLNRSHQTGSIIAQIKILELQAVQILKEHVDTQRLNSYTLINLYPYCINAFVVHQVCYVHCRTFG
jgi:hypothetical protein